MGYFSSAYSGPSGDFSISFEDVEFQTQQSFADECDINFIMDKYRVSGAAPLSSGAPVYADLSSAEDYHTSLNRVFDVEDAFALLDSKIRAKFENDPLLYLEYMEDSENFQESIELGLRPADAERPKTSRKEKASIETPPTESASQGKPEE